MEKKINGGDYLKMVATVAQCIGYSRSFLLANGVKLEERERFNRDVIAKLQEVIDILNK
jgi:hypothetical protein